MNGWVLRCPAEGDRDQKGKKKPDPSGQEAHVVACGAEDCVDRIAFGSGQMVSVQMAVFLQMPDHRLDATASSHLTPDRPETGYGYLEVNGAGTTGGGQPVKLERFVRAIA
jgi:hypothetical protein